LSLALIFAKVPDDGPCGPGINIVPLKLLYVLHFNAYALQFTLHGLQDELEFDEEFVNDVGHPAVIPHVQELEHELDGQELELELDGHELDGHELFVVV